ncbi:MAG: hypothetical protein IPG69_14525 [Flavobacteriales bacterium]|nr:hypothetical protein [Flavobacteriales bacterium]
MDTAIVPIAAGDTMHFYYYFYSTPGDAIGYTRVGMRNENDQQWLLAGAVGRVGRQRWYGGRTFVTTAWDRAQPGHGPDDDHWRCAERCLRGARHVRTVGESPERTMGRCLRIATSMPTYC